MSSHSVDIQNTQVYLKNTSCNTFPIVCASCGSNDYFQTFRPINCLYPCISRLKDSSDFCEDGFSIRQPILSSPPLFQPLFQNNLIPANVFCENTSKKIKSNIIKNEFEGRSEDEFKAKSNFKSDFLNNNSSSDKMMSNKNISNNSINSSNIQKSESDSCNNQSCTCRNDVSWGCSPIIVPIIPYYLIWNPKCPDIKHMHSNNEEKAKETTKDNKTKENFIYTECKSQKDFHMDIKDCLPNDDKKVQDECVLDNKATQSQWIPKDPKLDSSSSLFSLSSLDCCEESVFFAGDQVITNKNSFHDSSIHKSVTFDSINVENLSNKEKETEAVIETKMIELDSSCAELNSEFCLSSCLTHETILYNANMTSNNSQPLLIPETLFKTKIPDTGDLSPEFTKGSDQEVNLGHSNNNNIDFRNDSDILNKEKTLEEDAKIKVDMIKTKLEDRTSNKKSLKNFTMSDLSNSGIKDEIKVFDSAAGDLGSGNSSYRIIMSPSTSEQLGENLRKSLPGQCSQKGLEPKEKILTVSHENKNAVLDKTNSVKEQKNFKSGIAKLSNNFKTKELKSTEMEKKELGNKDPKPKAQLINKRKLTSIPTKNAIEINENNVRAQKIRKDQVVQNHTHGLEKQNMGSKTAQEKEKLFKKDVIRKTTKTNLQNSSL